MGVLQGRDVHESGPVSGPQEIYRRMRTWEIKASAQRGLTAWEVSDFLVRNVDLVGRAQITAVVGFRHQLQSVTLTLEEGATNDDDDEGTAGQS